MEDFAQVMNVPPVPFERKFDASTEQLATIIHAVMGPDAYLELIRRVTFVVASGNNDAHLKNWALIYPDGVTPRLSPLFDQVASVAWPRFEKELALTCRAPCLSA